MAMRKLIKICYQNIANIHLEWRCGPLMRGGRLNAPKFARHVAILTPSSVGNLGDEAMVASVVSALRARYPEILITLITHHETDEENYRNLNVKTICIAGYFSRFAAENACKMIGKLFTEVTDFILLGADIIDGRYNAVRSFRRLFMAYLASISGLNVFVLGFSFSDDADLKIVNFIRSHCFNFTFVPREPISAARLSRILGRNLDSGADLAFLLPVTDEFFSESAQNAGEVIERWRQSGKLILAINANPLGVLTADSAIDLELVVRSYAKCINTISKKIDCGIIFVTHDNRPGPHSDKLFISRIIQKLDTTVTYHFLEDTIRATEIKRLCSMIDLTVTGRMHLGIASLGAGTPTMILDFQGKVQGLLALFGQPEMVFNISELIDSEKFCEKVCCAINTRDRLSAQIRDKQKQVHSLSLRNIDALHEKWLKEQQ